MRKLSACAATALAAFAAAALSGQANAQGRGEPTAAFDTVTVTGSRAIGRTVENSPVAIDVITARELDAANRPDLIDILSATVPSWNTPLRGGSSDLGSMVRAAQLRGLSPNHTLVLINGRRWHPTALLGAGGLTGQAPVDIALIPSGVIERVEVLRDGASAIYGSDAIAGVINIITNKSSESGEVSYRWGEYFKGEGVTRVWKGGAGFGWGDDGYVRLSGQFNDAAATVTNSPVPPEYLYYFPLDANGSPVLPLNAAGRASAQGWLLPPGAAPDPREATRDNNAQRISGNRPTELKSITLDAGRPLTGAAELYSFLNYSQREVFAVQNFRPAYRDENVRALFPNGFSPRERLDEEDYGIIVGLRGTWGSGWDWDLSTTYGRDLINLYISDTVNPTYGTDSKTSFFLGRLRYTSRIGNFDLRRSFDVGGLAEPVQFTLGVEDHQATYRRWNGEEQTYSHGGWGVIDGPNAGNPLPVSVAGTQALPGFKPADNVDTSRNSRSLYTSVALNPTPKLLLDLAARYERYSDFGHATAGRISTRYELGDRASLRATLSNGFQAPVLAAPSYRTTTVTPAYTTHTLATTSAEALALGAKPLEPEESKNYTIGLVFEPWRDLNVAIDVYRIDVEGRIAATTTFGESLYPGSGALVEAAGLPANDRIIYLINAANTETTGIDVTVEKPFDLGRFGYLRLAFAVNKNDGKLSDVAPTPPVLENLDIPVFSEANKNTLLYLAPKSKEMLTFDWRKDRWGAILRLTHYGDIDRYGSPESVATSGPYAGLREIPYNIGDSWVMDLDVEFEIGKGWNASFSASNLFDVLPDQLPQPLVAANQYYAYATNGPLTSDGGFYSATIRYQW